MEKEIGKLPKNDTTEILLRIDDFGGKRGFTIREFVTSERYTGFTKAGVRILAKDFSKFKQMVNSISETEMNEEPDVSEEKPTKKKSSPKINEELPDY